MEMAVYRLRANAEMNFRNGGRAEALRRGGRPIPIRLGLPTRRGQRPLASAIRKILSAFALFFLEGHSEDETWKGNSTCRQVVSLV
jgi:hypothetical protein